MGELRVWWIPQVPMSKPFYVTVNTVTEGVNIMSTLAAYDLFQFENNIKTDFCNSGGLEQRVNGGAWEDWCDEDSGEDDPRVWLVEQGNHV